MAPNTKSPTPVLAIKNKDKRANRMPSPPAPLPSDGRGERRSLPVRGGEGIVVIAKANERSRAGRWFNVRSREKGCSLSWGRGSG